MSFNWDAAIDSYYASRNPYENAVDEICRYCEHYGNGYCWEHEDHACGGDDACDDFVWEDGEDW